MNKHRLSVLFVIANNRKRKDGKSPLICRITYNQKRKPFATGQFVNPKYWRSKEQTINNPNDDYINSQLSLIKQKLNQAFLLLQYGSNEFNVNDIYNQFAGKKSNAERTVKDAFTFHIDRMQKLVGIEVTQTSLDKYPQTQKHLVSFLWMRYKKKDYLLRDLKLNFINDFEYYLKVEKKFMPNTIYKTIQRFRRVIRVSVGADYLQKDPFVFHKIKKPKKQIVYLTETELRCLEEYNFTQIRLQQVSDMFVFCCYTGLAYQEMASLKEEHLIKGFDGNIWIQMMRKKTQGMISIPLLPKALEILSKYKKEDSLLPIITNQKFNSYLKEVAEIIGVQKNLTHHIARKTFATTVLLYNDVPMEIVSELLGHSKISITQESYGKIVQKKISEQMIKLSSKL